MLIIIGLSKVRACGDASFLGSYAAAQVLGLQPPRAIEDQTKEQVENTCFLCFTNGKPIEECCIKDVSTREYTPGHGRKQKGFLCEFFDGKFPTGDAAANALRERKIKDAARLRGNAMKAFSKRAKLAQETS